MRVCYLISGMGVGGAEFALLRLCRALGKQGVDTSVISVSHRGELAPRFSNEGNEVLALDLPGVSGLFTARSKVKSHLHRTRPDLVHGWMYHGNLVATLLGRSDRVQRPVLWSIRQSLEGNQDKPITRVLVRMSGRLSSWPDAILYNSTVARLQHEAAGFCGRRAHVIPNGIEVADLRSDPGVRRRIRSSLGISEKDFCIGHVARFHPSKDHKTFLRAFAGVLNSNRGTVAVLVGSGVDDENQDLQALIESLGVGKHVRLLGCRFDVSDLMPSFDLFCSSSSGMEGFPNVVAEAMSCELPCVVTNVGESPIIVGTFGEVVPPQDERALTLALERIMRMPEAARHAMGRSARERIAVNYSIDAVASQFFQLYASLANPQDSSACAA